MTKTRPAPNHQVDVIGQFLHVKRLADHTEVYNNATLMNLSDVLVASGKDHVGR